LKKVYLFALLVLGLTVLACIDIAKAQWSAINSGYAVTTNWHKIDVPLGQTVVATAGTTDSDVTHVEFIWRDSSNSIVWDENITISGPLTTPVVPPDVPQEVIKWAQDNSNTEYWYAQSRHIPNATGKWSVQAIFHNVTKPKGKSSVNFEIRSASFNVIPDAPIVGTAGIVSAMALGLALFKYKRTVVKHRT